VNLRGYIDLSEGCKSELSHIRGNQLNWRATIAYKPASLFSISPRNKETQPKPVKTEPIITLIMYILFTNYE
jgi:hypothetical protein